MHARCPICLREGECCASGRLRGVHVCLGCHFAAPSDFFDVWIDASEVAKRELEREARIKRACPARANNRVIFGRSARRARGLPGVLGPTTQAKRAGGPWTPQQPPLQAA